MRVIILVVAALWTDGCLGQINQALKRELDSIYITDQQYRDLLARIYTGQGTSCVDSLRNALGVPANQVVSLLWEKQTTIDQSNLKRMEQLFAASGYPGRSQVGQPTNEVAWNIIQHSAKIAAYFPLIRQAGKYNELPLTLVATMQDRWLVEQNQPQRYGTQGVCRNRHATPEQEDCFIWPIQQPAWVNKRRKVVGFRTSVEENARAMHIPYEALSMARMRKTYITRPVN